MPRARIALLNLVAFALLATSVAVASGAGVPDGGPVVAAVPTWPISTLLVSEVETGGASASDEFVELTNAGSATVDLAGLEIVYVTSSGGTITRKAIWASSVPLDPGRHILVANASGVYASIADVTYSGGFAATGGALVLRVVGGAPVDAVGWGDATNGFVEGAAAPAPPAGSSIERRPGGIDGNSVDTNVNIADWFVQGAPSPQNLSAPPVPAPGASPTPTAVPSPDPTVTPDPTATPDPTVNPTPTPTPSPEPTPSPTPTEQPTPTPTPTATPPPSPTPTPEPTPAPTPTPDPSPTPTPEPTPNPSPTPAPVAVPIADARLLPDGAVVTVEGTLTTALGALEGGRTGFVQDVSGGIAVYLDTAPVSPWPAEAQVRLIGTLGERYSARTLRVALSDVLILGSSPVPNAFVESTGAIGEAVEGRRVSVTGTVIGSPTSYADGTGIIVDDGTGPVRVIVDTDVLAGADLVDGLRVTAIGPVGQRDSSGTGTSGYRIHATEPRELVILPDPTPSPSPTPSPTTEPTPTPEPTAPPTPSPTPDPTPEPGILSVAVARTMPVGSVLRIGGVVVAETGRLGLPPVFAVADPAAGIAVRLVDGIAAPPRGTSLVLDGVLADPYGQLELRLIPGGLRIVGPGVGIEPLRITGAQLGESVEGRLITIDGRITRAPTRATSGDLSVELADPSGARVRLMADGSSGITPDRLMPGTTYRITGIAGQRASRKGALDGYRIWIRDIGDIVPLSAGAGAAAAIPIGEARARDGATVVVTGIVTAGSGLLDADGRRVVLQDRSAGIEIVLPAGERAVVGERLTVTGEVGRAWGAPRIRATAVERLGAAAVPSPVILTAGPGASLEWRLVRVSGRVLDVRRFGASWRAELAVGSERVVVSGLAGASIASTALVEGRLATVVGIVRRPYPSATDRRYTIVPRGPSDVALGPRDEASRTDAGGVSGRADAMSPVPPGPVDVDLATLGDHVGAIVRVGGLVVEPMGDGFTLDDATAVGHVVLEGDAAAFVALLEPGDALDATGRVERRGPLVVLVVTDPGGLVRVGDLGQPVALGEPATETPDPGSDSPPGAQATADLPLPGGPPAGLAGLAALSILSVAASLVRRRIVRIRAWEVARARIRDLGRRPDAA